jgi:2',3'-cyclic-nucleotide 2'-phosphodiesterase (5'-nucleotidase family)
VAYSSVVLRQADACGTGNGRTCESQIGDLTTDALRATYNTDFAFMNAGGIRATLTCTVGELTCGTFSPPPYPISVGKLDTVFPFGNYSTTLSLSGTELKVRELLFDAD